MRIAVSEAKAQLTELVRRAESGEEIILTRHGAPAVRLTPVRPLPDAAETRAARLKDLQRRAAAKALPGPSAARSQDFLYGDDGLPE
ncbi:type II toxin-antitoxin system prevent-host-death family antitoxin [Rhodoblastus acidophilus]|uniref:Antitoxin n=1 Tax=Rhodoblastus acidophilus TaxID=1074 RepID=A0A6N8DKJ8_RHOAC|nr:type II toxin-antitoxin system prevent-host-death family antitoxin [Rhodoblastus acidophilus]MCW2274011.1 prevent-host-death family protein [Rhodoblastus acidophilus]MTV30848.1 type II toxin-antitoxin system prevent-host-death family antitoxin [Rhodoblastus acidophilus]